MALPNKEDCSPLGLEILKHIEEQSLSFTELANITDISRAALRICILKQGTPGKRTVIKLAKVLNHNEMELERLICENKLRQISENN